MKESWYTILTKERHLTRREGMLWIGVSFVGLLTLLSIRVGHICPESPPLEVSVLHGLVAGQEKFRSNAHLDTDEDGIGEYGTLEELEGLESQRLRKPLGTPIIPLDSWTGRPMDSDGTFLQSGYLFRLYLPDGKKGWVLGRAPQISDSQADAAEERFLILAWPLSYGESGSKCYFVDESRIVKTANNEQWMFSGRTKPMTPSITTHADFRPWIY